MRACTVPFLGIGELGRGLGAPPAEGAPMSTCSGTTF